MALILLFASAVLAAWLSLHTFFWLWKRYQHEFTVKTDGSLQRLFLFADVRKLFLSYVLGVVLLTIMLLVLEATAILLLLFLVLAFYVPKLIIHILQSRRRRAINEALPDALQQMSGAMQAGSTFVAAMQMMAESKNGPIEQEFSLLLREHKIGARLEVALERMGHRVETEEMDLLISAALISQELGGNLSEILNRLSTSLRNKMEMEGKVKSLTAQGVMQGYVVTALPFLLMLALLFIEPGATLPLFTSLLGWLFLAVILLLQLFGGLMIRKIISVDV